MRRREASLKQILQRVLPEGARERVFSVELVRRRWADVVGHELARQSEPEALSEGVLTIRVTDPVWGKMIYKLQGRIIPGLNRALGSSLVRRINFTKRSRLERPVEAESKEREPEPVVPPPRLVDAAEAIEEPELRELVLRSAARYLKAQERRRK